MFLEQKIAAGLFASQQTKWPVNHDVGKGGRS
jgi:hypothetical protein